MEPKEAIRQSAVWHPGHGGPPGTPHEYLGWAPKYPKIDQKFKNLSLFLKNMDIIGLKPP